MTEKNHIIDALGERKLLLPALVNSALAANDQAKYLFTLLQMAKSHADCPDGQFTNLRQERLLCGLEDEDLDHVVEHSEAAADGEYRVPGAGRIVGLVMRDIKTMLDPFASGGAGQADEARQFAQRYAQFAKTNGQVHADAISGTAIAQLTSGSREHGDRPHLLVMDMHKALNRVQAAIAVESIDGARVYEIKAASGGLRENRADPLIRDEVKVELLNYFRSAQQSLIDIAADHAALIVEIASGIHDALLKAQLPDAPRYFERNAQRAKEWEHQADACVNRERRRARAVRRDRGKHRCCDRRAGARRG